MPNWTECKITATGDKDALDRMLAGIVNDNGVVDFERFAPTEQLKADPEYQVTILLDKDAPDASKRQIATLLAECGGKVPADSEQCVRNLLSTKGIRIKENLCGDLVSLEKSGQPGPDGSTVIGKGFNWYKAHLDTWCVKWNLADSSINRISDGEARIMFETANDVPEMALEALAARYPEINFVGVFDEPLMNIYATMHTDEGAAHFDYRDIDDIISDSDKADAVATAIREAGLDPDNYDIDSIVENECYTLDLDGCLDSFDEASVYYFLEADDLQNYSKETI